MKTVLSLIFAAALALSLVLTGCEGPAGPSGKDGKDGQDSQGFPFNLEGFAAGIKCGTCHTPGQDTTYFLAGRVYQWEQSKHALGGDSERNGSSCAGCHTTEGFIQRMNGQPVTNQSIPSPPGCFACHSPHARGDFSLRNADPVTIGSNIVGVADAVFDYGAGNLCVQCHQTRSMSPKMDGNAAGDSLLITNTRWYSHYGVQGQMLLGNGGFQFPGYAYTGNSPHTTIPAIKQQGCPICHMAEQTYPPAQGTGKAGGHTMNIHYVGEGGEVVPLLTGCNQTGCHTSPAITAASLEAVQEGIEQNLDTLFTLLGNRGWVDTVSTSAGYGGIKLTGGRLVIRPAVKAGALYNYLLVEHDMSKGVHNTNYTTELLRSSIEALRIP